MVVTTVLIVGIEGCIRINNLAAVNQKLVMECHPTKIEKDPQAYFANAHFKVCWLCQKCGHEWAALIHNRNGNRSGCPNCYENNFKNKHG